MAITAGQVLDFFTGRPPEQSSEVSGGDDDTGAAAATVVPVEPEGSGGAAVEEPEVEASNMVTSEQVAEFLAPLISQAVKDELASNKTVVRKPTTSTAAAKPEAKQAKPVDVMKRHRELLAQVS